MLKTNIRAHEARRLMVALLVIVLIAAAVNVPFALTRMLPTSGAFPPATVFLDGQEAAAKGWPSATPHDVAWSAPDDWQLTPALGFRRYWVSAPALKDGGNNFLMDVQHLGWPLPAIEVKQMWWDWGDPQLDGPESNPAPALVPLGVVVNPLLVGVPIWLLVCVLPYLALLTRRAVRARRGHCPWCGFDARDLAVCPECGRSGSAMVAETDSA